MAELLLHGRELNSVFELLGDKENDITYSVGWAMSRCPEFLRAVLAHLLPGASAQQVDSIRLQAVQQGAGITDIEIIGPELHLIVEAKCGWSLPGAAQLKRYVPRLGSAGKAAKAIVVMSECSEQYAQTRLPKTIDGFDVLYLRWHQLEKLAHGVGDGPIEQRLMEELRAYLKTVVIWQDLDSSLVYVVSLGSNQPKWSQLSWQEIVIKKGRYFHPVGGNGWPKSPPNYLGFRYRGRLQSVHPVKACTIVTDLNPEIPEIQKTDWPPHFLYTLGAAIRPTATVRTGNIYRNGRVWAALDHLMTAKTIAEARDLTKKHRRD